MCDIFFGDRVHHAIAVLFDFIDGACIVIVGMGGIEMAGAFVIPRLMIRYSTWCKMLQGG